MISLDREERRRLDPDSQNLKLQKSISELVRRIDNHHHSAIKLSEVFSSEVIKLRVRLGEYVLKLIFTNPEKYALKYLEIQWRKCWHDPVTLARNIGSGNLNHYLQFHIQSGVGHMHNLILVLQERYGGGLQNVGMDWKSMAQYGFSRPGSTNSSSSSDSTTGDWSRDVMAKILIWLGDLNRYNLEFCPESERSMTQHLAKKYYSVSTLVHPHLALPYNQLASFAGDDKEGVSALFFYLKCVTSQVKFDGGETNLNRFLEKRGPPSEPSSLMADASWKLILMVRSMLIMSEISEDREQRVMVSCHQSLTSLQEMLSGISKHKEDDQPDGNQQDLEADQLECWLARSCASVILTMIFLADKPDAGNMVGLCQAWLLSVSCELARRLLRTVGEAIHGDTFDEEMISTKDTRTIGEGKKEDEAPKEETPPKEKKKRKKLRDLLRRRKASNSDSSRASETDSDSNDEDGDLSGDDESDEDLGSTEYFDDDDELFLSDSEDGTFSNEDSEDDVIIEEEVEVIKHDNEVFSSDQLVKLLQQSGLFAGFTLCLLWLRSQPQVLEGLSGQDMMFWNKFARILTLININSSSYARGDRLKGLMEKCSERPSEEMYYLRGCKLFQNQFEEMRWSSELVSLPVREETASRLVYLDTWRNWFLNQEKFPVRWHEGEERAVILEEPDVSEQQPAKGADTKSVMKHMAELWLKDEVSNLERSKSSAKILLVVDAAALLQDLNTVRRAASIFKFKIIVPQVVIRRLDHIKKIDRMARHSIRWLERELSRGHKGLLAQEDHQRKQTSMPPPSDRKSDDWARFNILECISYHMEQTADTEDQVIFVTADQHILDKSAIEAVQVLVELGVQVESVTDFIERVAGVQENRPRTERRRRDRRSDNHRSSADRRSGNPRSDVDRRSDNPNRSYSHRHRNRNQQKDNNRRQRGHGGRVT